MRTNYTYRNLLGKTFGKLTVIEDAGIGKNDHMWKCECLCGNIVTITSSKLTSGHNKSCGCLRGDRREVLTGQKFGILTVIERILLRVNKNKKKDIWLVMSV